MNPGGSQPSGVDPPHIYHATLSQESTGDEESKKKDGKRWKDGTRKDIGYVMFEQELNSEEEELVTDSASKSPVKVKKMKQTKPSFKFSKKEKSLKPKEKEKDKEKEKEEKKEKEKKEKEKKDKGDKDQRKEEEVKQKFSKKLATPPKPELQAAAAVADIDGKLPVFGIALSMAVERSPCHDGIQLPVIVRECIDYIEEFGLTCEGIYRVSGVKSKVQALKDAYNKGVEVYLHEHEPSVVASLLKQFLRELAEPVLTHRLNPKFEQASTLKTVKPKVELFQQLIDELPACNRLLLSWMIVHMSHVIAKEAQNKMSLQNVSIVLSPTMQISHRVLHVLFTYSKVLFRDADIKRYVPPLRPVTSRWTLELPESPGAVEEELRKQESLLSHLHEELMRVKDGAKEEQLWEVQRVVTQLKRKLKHAKQVQQSADLCKRREEEIARDKLSLPSLHRASTHSRTKDDRQRDRDRDRQRDSRHSDRYSDKDLELGGQGESQGDGQADRRVDKQGDAPPGDRPAEEGGLETAQGLRTTPAPQPPPPPQKHRRSVEMGRKERGKEEVGAVGVRSKHVGGILRAPEKEVSTIAAVERLAQPPHPVAVEPIMAECNVTDGKAVTVAKQDLTQSVIAEQSIAVIVAEPELDEPVERKLAIEKSEEEPRTDVQLAQSDEQSVKVTDGTGIVEANAVPIVASGEEQAAELNVPAVISTDQELAPKELIEPHLTADPVEGRVAENVEQELEAPSDDDSSSNAYTDVLEEELEDLELGDSGRERGEEGEGAGERGEGMQYVPLGDEESPGITPHRKPLEPDVTFEDSSSSSLDSRGERSSEEEEEEVEELERKLTYLTLQEEELLALRDELRQKIATENDEIESLHQDIAEVHSIHQDLSSDSDGGGGSPRAGSSSSEETDEEDDDQLREVLRGLMMHNDQLEKDNANLCEKIHQERQICIDIKVNIRMLQLRNLDTSGGGYPPDGFTDRETLL